jgi:methylthioribulose-1-phosphate dehydratase
MKKPLDQLAPRAALVDIARDFHARGWMPGTAGNLSVRVRDPLPPEADPAAVDTEDTFWITASGLPKGRLAATDFVRVAVKDGAVVERFDVNARPSAESAIHQVIYRHFADAMACLHVHTVDACLACADLPSTATDMPLPPLEMIKGLGVWQQNPRVVLPLFENILDVAGIAEAINWRFKGMLPTVPALMIRGHGVTVWGTTVQEAYNRIEVVEFLMSYLARAQACK